jgi:hypothetical protein
MIFGEQREVIKRIMNVKGGVDHQKPESSKRTKKLAVNRAANKSNFAEKEHLRNL